MICDVCRAYRMGKGVTLRELSGDDGEKGAKSLSAFENGRSSNIKHLDKYINLAKELDDLPNFMGLLIKEYIRNG